jgi:hypothetical protein
MMDDLPSNSSRARRSAGPKETPEPETEKKVERVISSSVTRRKKPIGKKIKETFFGGDPRDVTEHIVQDVVVPGIKNTISDMLIETIERAFYNGEARSGTRRGASRFGAPHNPYNRYSSTGQPTEKSWGGKPDPRSPVGTTRRGRAMHDFEEIILDTKSEAEEILDRLVGHCEQFEGVTVAELYTMLGEKATWQDEKWGWNDLRDARTSRVRGGYLLDLPRPEPID